MDTEPDQPAPKKAHPTRRKNTLRDIFSLITFVVAVVVSAYLLNSFVFQSFNVFGPSMQPTLETGDRLVVNKIPVTWKHVRDEQYIPPRGQVIVFRNPLVGSGGDEEHLVKRVIGLPGERVLVADGRITVFNDEYPQGFQPAATLGLKNIKEPTSGTAEVNVPDSEIFVVGDNRVGSNSLDSRNGLGTVALELVEGPVYARIYPFGEFRFF